MNEIININGIECYEKDGIAYLKLEAVARGLGFTTVASSGNEVVRWKRVDGYLREIGFSQEVAKDAFIPENIFYRLAMKAKNEAAERFQAKIADEVIPTIRKHGAYMTPAKIEEVLLNPDTIIQLATTLKEERVKRAALEAENTMQKQIIAEYEPKAQYVDKILSSKGTLTVKQIAADYDMTAQQLNRILHEEHVQYKVNDQWILYKEHMGMGYTKSNQVPIIHSDGRDGFKLHTQWTQKGRLFIHKILTKRGIMAVIDRKLAGEQIAM